MSESEARKASYLVIDDGVMVTHITSVRRIPQELDSKGSN
jgi:hypothetical protein